MVLFEELTNQDNLIKKYTLWKGERDNWLRYALYCRDIYFNDVDGTKTIFNAEQFKKIKEQWNIPISINKVYPSASQEIAILSKNKPSFKIAAYDDRGKDYAVVLDKLVKNVLYNSNSELEEEEIIKDVITMGMGIAYIERLLDYEVGTLPFKYKRLDPRYVILDPNTKERDLSDSSGFFIDKEITKEQALLYYKPLIDAINKKYDKNLTIEDFTTPIGSAGTVIDTEPRIRVLEYYDRVYTNMYFVRDINTGDILRYFEEDLEEDRKFILNDAIDVELNRFVRRRLILGKYLVYEEILPITKFPIQVKFFEWKDGIYNCYGLVHFVRDMQESLTKSIQLLLVNGMLTNNAGWLAPIGSIRPEDREKWERMGNVPGVIKEYLPQIIDGVLLKPEREGIQPISNFYPTIIDLLASGIDLVTGINPAVRGEPSPRIEVFSTLKALQEAATYRIELALNHILVPNYDLGKVLVQYIFVKDSCISLTKCTNP